MLKLAENKHIEEISSLVYSFVEEEVKWDKPDLEVIQNVVSSLVNSPLSNSVVIIEENNQKEIVGILMGSTTTSIFSKKKMSVEIAYYVKPKYRNLKLANEFLYQYEYWAKEIAKVDHVCLACLDERVENLYKRKGFKKYEQSFVKEY